MAVTSIRQRKRHRREPAGIAVHIALGLEHGLNNPGAVMAIVPPKATVALMADPGKRLFHGPDLGYMGPTWALHGPRRLFSYGKHLHSEVTRNGAGRDSNPHAPREISSLRGASLSVGARLAISPPAPRCQRSLAALDGVGLGEQLNI